MSEKILDQYITVYLSITGWTAVHRVFVHEDSDRPGEGYWDNQQTGIGKYVTREEALVEARNWAKSDEIRLVE